MSILDCYGQDRAIIQLQRARQARRVPHSYIFHGPEGVGKGLLARQWAKLLLCSQPVRDTLAGGGADCGPGGSQSYSGYEIDNCCDSCQDCHLAEAGTHPDMHRISRRLSRHTKAGRTSQLIALPIDVVREYVIEPAGVFPSRGRARVFIIEEAHAMSRSAQNSLLKTLEEPPENTFLLLITSKPDMLLPTTHSRCQAIRFSTLPGSFIREKLKQANIEGNQSDYWSDFCDGRLGEALTLAKMNLYGMKCDLIRMLAELNYGSVLLMAKWMIEQAKEFGRNFSKENEESESSAVRRGQLCLLHMIIHAFRQALRMSVQTDTPKTDIPDQGEILRKIAEQYGPVGSGKAIRATYQAENKVHANVNGSLIFESLLLNYIDYARKRK